MSRPVARYNRSSKFAWLTLIATIGSLFSVWEAQTWSYSYIAAILFALPAVGLGYLSCRPSVRVYDTHLGLGRRTIAWSKIRGVDHLGLLVPLVVRLRFLSGEQEVMVFAGERDTAVALLEHIRRWASAADLDGIPHRDYWNQREQLTSKLINKELPGKLTPPVIPVVKRIQDQPPARYRLLRPEDEAEVEQMYQRLKSVGRMEARDLNDSDDQ